MSPTQKRYRELLDRQSRERGRMAEIAALDAGKITPEVRAEAKGIEEGTPDLELQIRAARSALDADEAASVVTDPNDKPLDAEARERIELRSKVSIGRYLAIGMKGGRLDGAEEEYRQAVGASERTIPIDAFESEGSDEPERRADMATAAPGTIGVNMQGVVPAAFSGSIASRIGIAMPRAPSGQYSVPRLTTNLTAGTKAKGAVQESTAGQFTVISAKPTRISARLSLRAEDLAEVGIPNFEGALRQNLRLVLGDKLDEQLIAGDGTDPNVQGLMAQLTADDAPGAAVRFATFAADMAGLLDGKWAAMLRHLRLVSNAAVYGKLASTFASSDDSVTALDWASRHDLSVWCNARMPASASNVGKCIAMRSGAMVEPMEAASMPACSPFWGDIEISDPYSDSGSATRHVTLHVLLGDVLIKQPDAFAEVRIKTA